MKRAVNPYCFSVGGVGVKIEFAEGGPSPLRDKIGLLTKGLIYSKRRGRANKKDAGGRQIVHLIILLRFKAVLRWRTSTWSRQASPTPSVKPGLQGWTTLTEHYLCDGTAIAEIEIVENISDGIKVKHIV